MQAEASGERWRRARAARSPSAEPYTPVAPFRDELFEAPGTPRPHAQALIAGLESLGREGLAEAGRRRDAIFLQQGITFETTGEEGPTRERPFPLDLVPRVLTGEEWTTVKRGLAQRIRALNHFVDDVYHGREIVRDGIVPWHLVANCSSFARAVHGIRPPGGVYCHVAGCDLVRDTDGTWQRARGQRAHAVGHLLRAREPRRDGAPRARAVRLLPRAAGRPLPAAAARRAALGRAVDRQRGDGRRLDAGPDELGLLRARLPRAPDGRRARRGLGPRRARRGPLHAHDRRACAACTRSTAASTTTSSTRSSSAPTRCSACRASCAPTAPARSRSPTRSAPASPTTRPSTTTSRR